MIRFCVLLILLATLFSLNATHTHVGQNIWIYDGVDNGIEMPIPQCSVSEDSYNTMEFGDEKTWKCPYCHHYWPMGTPCQNESCPSRF